MKILLYAFETMISDDAGRYVCNYSMYVLGSWAKSRRKKYAFLHIPKTCDTAIAVQYIERELSVITSKVISNRKTQPYA